MAQSGVYPSLGVLAVVSPLEVLATVGARACVSRQIATPLRPFEPAQPWRTRCIRAKGRVGCIARVLKLELAKEITMNAQASESEHPDHRQLRELLEEAKALNLTAFPDQQKVWVEESPLAQEIKLILANHPEYYAEVRAVVGDVFPNPNS